MIENRNGLVVAACATQSSTKAEREAALAMLQQRGRTPGEVKKKRLRPSLWEPISCIKRKIHRRAATAQSDSSRGRVRGQCPLAELVDRGRQNAGMAINQRKRKLVEKVFGWASWTALCGK